MPTHFKAPVFPALFLRIVLLFAAGCGLLKGADDDERFPPYDNKEEVEAYYSKKPEFFQRNKTLADLPGDLVWTSGGSTLREPGSPDAQKGGSLRFWIPSFPPSLRIVGTNANNSFRGEHLDDVTIYLAQSHPDDYSVYLPGLAKEWAFDKDKRTVYFRLDPEARFSNGDPVTPEDFLMTFYVMQSPYHQDPWYSENFGEKYFTRIVRYDSHTISITLAEAKPDLLYYMQFLPLNVRYFSEFGPDYLERYNWRKYPTTGAYDIKEEDVIKGRRITMSRVKDWWAKDRPNFRYRFNPDRISYDVILTPEKAFNVFRKGDLDYFWLDNPNFWYDKMDIPEYYAGYICKSTFYNDWPRPPWSLYVNCAKPLLDNRTIREGINYAVNFQKVLDIVFRGDAERLRITAEGYGRFSNPNVKAREFSPEKARALFVEAGFTQTDSDGILKNAQGTRLTFKLNVRKAPLHERIGLLVAEEARKAGLLLEVAALDNTAAFKLLREKQHDISITAWNSTPPYPRYWEGFHSDNAFEKEKDGTLKKGDDGRPKAKPNTNNICSIGTKELDEVIDKYEKATSLDEVQSLAWQAEDLIYKDACYIPGWVMPFFRTGYWRWVRWPEGFHMRVADLCGNHHVLWIDEKLKAETQQARKEGRVFEEVDVVYDQFRAPPVEAPAAGGTNKP